MRARESEPSGCTSKDMRLPTSASSLRYIDPLLQVVDEDGIKRTRRTFWTIDQIRRTIQNKKNQIAELEKELDRIIETNRESST